MRARLVCVYALAVALPLSAQTTPYRSESFVTADSVRLRYVVQGSGPLVVLLHGFALSAELNWVWPGAVDSLAGSFTVIALDLRGHGESGKPRDPAAYGPRFADDVIALLDHLHVQRAHLAGYSLGATIALLAATTHPDRVISLTLGGGGWHPPDAPPPPFFTTWLDGLDRAARGELSVSEALLRDDMPSIPAPVRAALDRNDPAALAAAFRSLPGLQIPESAVRAVRMPVHAVVGDRDPALHEIERLAVLLPKLTVTTIAEADHAGAMSHPRLSAAIREFARTQ